jgi:YfiH family protein
MPQPALTRNKEYYLFENSPPAKLICAFSTRILGNMSLCYGDTKDSLENRKNFLQELGINYQDLVCAQQVHGDKTRYVRETDKGKGAMSYETAISNTDALVTDKKNLPLAIFTADCLSIFLYDPKTPAIGLVHAGWKSIRLNIVARTLRLMQEKFDTEVKDLSIGFGPAIRNCCYAVEKEFTDFFNYGLTQKDGHYYLDLVEINKRQLLDLGIKDKNIFDFGICTVCRNIEFFSYREEGNNCGRMMSVMMLL